MTTTGHTDSLGVEILVGDTVTVASWGDGVRLADVGHRFLVTGLSRAKNLTHDTDVADGRAVRPGNVLVARRDGTPGHQGNV